MKIQFKLENLDCANCAAKIERAISKIKGVKECSVNFFTSKMTLVIEESDTENVLREAERLAKKHEPDMRLIRI